MRLRLAIAVGAIGLAAMLSSGVPAMAAPAPATVLGKLSTGTTKLPRSAKTGQAQVLAMNIDTRAFGDVAQVDRSGRYKLELPPGKWALLSSVVTLGTPFASFLSAGIVTRAGQRRTLPLTLKKFKKPRKKVKPKASAANINPRDGRAYKGEAYAVRNFTVVGGGSELAQLGRGMMEMLVADLLQKPRCDFTLVEFERRDVIMDELKLQQSEHVDPASRVEPGHLIDPEIFIRGRVQDRPGTPHRLALIAWLEDAKTGARLSGDISSVTLHTDFFGSEERLADLLQRLMCSRTAPKPDPQPPPPLPSPPQPAPAPNHYAGTFSGKADSDVAGVHWTWNGMLEMDAAQDAAASPLLPPPNGAPPGSYRQFTVTSGSVDIALNGNQSGCILSGFGRFDVTPGLMNTLTIQLDVPDPAYALHIQGLPFLTVLATKSGSCGPGQTPFPIFTTWADTGTNAHTSSSMTLADSETVPDPEPNYHYTTRWSLSPG
jgi:hypothetical protein